MRHRRSTQYFSRKSGPRKALLRGLVVSLVEHERICTTLAKAKELRRHVEKAVTRGKGGSLHDYRLLMSDYPSEQTVSKLMKDISPRFKERNGGYTRIIKLGTRPGDRAEMAFIEFVDYDFEKAAEKKAAQKTTVRVKDAKGKSSKKEVSLDEASKLKAAQVEKAKVAKRKKLRKLVLEARKVNRAQA